MKNLKKNIHDYFSDRREVVAVYLFGSHAADRARPFSDVDIGVILHHQDIHHAFALQRRYITALGRLLRKDIHIVILNEAGEVLLKQIFSKGICVLVNHEKAFKKFKMIRYSMIAEFGRYLDMAQAGFRRKMIEVEPNG